MGRVSKDDTPKGSEASEQEAKELMGYMGRFLNLAWRDSVKFEVVKTK